MGEPRKLRELQYFLRMDAIIESSNHTVELALVHTYKYEQVVVDARGVPLIGGYISSSLGKRLPLHILGLYSYQVLQPRGRHLCITRLSSSMCRIISVHDACF
jgi:hypothetical protein